jgi:hypothetical protein
VIVPTLSGDVASSPDIYDDAFVLLQCGLQEALNKSVRRTALSARPVLGPALPALFPYRVHLFPDACEL